MTPRDPLPTIATLVAARAVSAQDLRGQPLAWARYAPDALRGQSRGSIKPRLVREVQAPAKISWWERLAIVVVFVAFALGISAVMARIRVDDVQTVRQRSLDGEYTRGLHITVEPLKSLDRRDSAVPPAPFRIVTLPHDVAP